MVAMSMYFVGYLHSNIFFHVTEFTLKPISKIEQYTAPFHNSFLQYFVTSSAGVFLHVCPSILLVFYLSLWYSLLTDVFVQRWTFVRDIREVEC
jgi:hypothetical protein